MSDNQQRPRVVIAGGSGRLGRALAAALAERFEVRVLTTSAVSGGGQWQCDLTSIAEAEVALASAHTVVFLARASRSPARLMQGALSDLDLLMADSVARAAARVGAQRVVFFACGEHDPREAILRTGGVALSVLRGGGPDPVAALVELVSAPGTEDRVLPAWSAPEDPPSAPPVTPRVWSIQRYEKQGALSAEALARAYFEWLPTATPLTRVEQVERTWRIIGAGVPVLVFRHSPGRSEPDCYVMEVVGGALVGSSRGRFEFRVLGDGSVLVALIDFAPSLPWPIYRLTQANAHARVMRSFGKALEAKSAALGAA